MMIMITGSVLVLHFLQMFISVLQNHSLENDTLKIFDDTDFRKLAATVQ